MNKVLPAGRACSLTSQRAGLFLTHTTPRGAQWAGFFQRRRWRRHGASRREQTARDNFPELLGHTTAQPASRIAPGPQRIVAVFLQRPHVRLPTPPLVPGGEARQLKINVVNRSKPDGDNLERRVCTGCGHEALEIPTVVVGAVPNTPSLGLPPVSPAAVLTGGAVAG